MDPELSLEASIKNCSMWRIETSTRLAYEKLGLPFKDDNIKLLNKKRFSSDSTKLRSRLHVSFKDDQKAANLKYGMRNGDLQLMNLPSELLELIFRNLSFDNIGKIRSVCQRFNTIASSVLNSEFSSLRISMLHRFQSIKAQMPRRESARRKHPLARESDIIETLHMRLTLLHMTFGKHIERKHCCFFAGEILDEVYRILCYVKSTPNLNRAYKVTDELFDLSQMAMEYFKEHIEPSLPEITYFATDFLEYTPTITSSPKTQVSLLEDSVACTSSVVSKLPSLESMSAAHMPMTTAIQKKMRKLVEQLKKQNATIADLKRDSKAAKKKNVQLQKQISELKACCKDYDRKFQNASHKFSVLVQELNRFKTDFQYWRSKSPATACSCGNPAPTLELGDPELFVADIQGKVRAEPPKSFGADDFKPIAPDIQSLPGTSTENAVSKNNGEKNCGNFVEAKEIAVASCSTSVISNRCSRACKRKLDLPAFDCKSKKPAATFNHMAYIAQHAEEIMPINQSLRRESTENIFAPEIDMTKNFETEVIDYEEIDQLNRKDYVPNQVTDIQEKDS